MKIERYVEKGKTTYYIDSGYEENSTWTGWITTFSLRRGRKLWRLGAYWNREGFRFKTFEKLSEVFDCYGPQYQKALKVLVKEISTKETLRKLKSGQQKSKVSNAT